MKGKTNNDRSCFFCGTDNNLERHHAIFGKNRKNSEEFSEYCCFWLCQEHHTGNNGVHSNNNMAEVLKQVSQRSFLKEHSMEEWMTIFGKNYL